MEVEFMILTFNYGDLQDIKKKMLKSKKINNKTIYICIESFKETLNYMYENNLLNNISKEMIEKEIQEFSKNMLSKCEFSYSELEKKYKLELSSHLVINADGAKFKL